MKMHHFIFVIILLLSILACGIASPQPAPPSPTPTEILPTPSPVSTSTPKVDPECLENVSFQTRLKVGDKARITDLRSEFNIRSSPEMADNLVVILDASSNMEFEIIDGPVCYPRPEGDYSLIYWKIFIPALNLEAWTAESLPDGYALELIDAFAVELAVPMPENHAEEDITKCILAGITTQAEIGDTMEVVEGDPIEDSVAFRLHNVEEFNYIYLVPSTKVEMVSGPFCYLTGDVGYVYWWYAYVSQWDLYGWVPENPEDFSGKYYLQPAQ